jgi:hypothetical protein
LKLEETEGILLEPPQTLDDIIEKVNEVSPTFTLLAEKCSDNTSFCNQEEVKVYSYGFAVPHTLKTSVTNIALDSRGVVSELIRCGMSFKNVSNQTIRIHANLPVAKMTRPGSIYTRLSGFYTKGKSKKRAMTDDVTLEPEDTIAFKVNLKNLVNEYVNMEQAQEGRLWINICTFCVVIDNINQETGAAFANKAEIVELRPKAVYTKRKSVVTKDSQMTYTDQIQENFVLMEMAGFDDLYAVDPVDAYTNFYSKDVSRLGGNNAGTGTDIITGGESDVRWTQEAYREGDLIGVDKVNITKDAKSYTGVGLVIKKTGGNARPVDLNNFQAGGTRLIIPGFNVAESPGYAPVFFSYFKYDPNVGHWVLWDDYEERPRYADDDLNQFTPCSAAIPIMVIEDVYTKKEKEEQLQLALELGTNQFGQPYGRPRGFGTFLKKALSILEVVAKVGGFIGTLL